MMTDMRPPDAREQSVIEAWRALRDADGANNYPFDLKVLGTLFDAGARHERARIVAWLRSPEAHNIVAKALHISDRQFPLEGPNVLANELEEHRD